MIFYQLYGKILIPEAVWDELNYRGEAWPGSKEVENADWIVKQKVENRHLIQALVGDLDRGEAECIAIVFIVRLCKESGLETIQYFNEH